MSRWTPPPRRPAARYRPGGAWLALLLAASTPGCLGTQAWSTLPPPWTAEHIDREPEIRVLTNDDGQHAVVVEPRVELRDGRAYLCGRDAERPSIRTEFALERIADVEVKRFDPALTVATIAAVVLIAAGLAYAYSMYTPSGGFLSF